MPLDDCADIRYAIVRHFHCISVEDLVQVASLGEMAVNLAEESVCAMSVATLRLNGGVNHVMFLFRDWLRFC